MKENMKNLVDSEERFVAGGTSEFENKEETVIAVIRSTPHYARPMCDDITPQREYYTITCKGCNYVIEESGSLVHCKDPYEFALRKHPHCPGCKKKFIIAN